MPIGAVTGALLLAGAGAGLQAWGESQRPSSAFSMDDPRFAGQQEHLRRLQQQRGMAGTLANKEAMDWLSKAGGKISGIRYDPRDAAAGARGQAQAMGGAAMDAGSMAMQNKMRREMLLEGQIGRVESDLGRRYDAAKLSEVERIPWQMRAAGALSQGSQLLGMMGGKKSPAAAATPATPAAGTSYMGDLGGGNLTLGGEGLAAPALIPGLGGTPNFGASLTGGQGFDPDTWENDGLTIRGGFLSPYGRRY